MFDDSPTSFHVQSFLLSLTNSSHSTIYTNLLYNALKGKMWSGVNMKAIIQINVSIKSPIGWNVAVYHTDDISDRVKFIYVTNNTFEISMSGLWLIYYGYPAYQFGRVFAGLDTSKPLHNHYDNYNV